MGVRIFHLAADDAVIINDGEFIHVPMRDAVGGRSRDAVIRHNAAQRAKIDAMLAERRRRACQAIRERLRARHLARQRDRIAAAKTAAKTAAPVKQTPPRPIPTPTPKLDTRRLIGLQRRQFDLQPPPYVYRVGYVHLNTE